MGLGRIKRSKSKIRATSQRQGIKAVAFKQFGVKIRVHRYGAGYMSYACIGQPPKTKLQMIKPRKAMERSRCARGTGRTPQSAIALSLKSLSAVVAKRGRSLNR